MVPGCVGVGAVRGVLGKVQVLIFIFPFFTMKNMDLTYANVADDSG